MAKRINQKQILITGGSGIVGFGFLRYLKFLRDNFGSQPEVILTSKTKDGLPILKSIDYKFTHHAGDLTDYRFAETLPPSDFLVLGAGYGQPSKFLENPYQTLELNAVGPKVLLPKTAENALFISSSEVYSGLEGLEIAESQIGTTNPMHPRASYIEGKRFGEAYVLSKPIASGAYGSIARLALAYGPGARENDSRVMNELINMGIRQGRVELRDSGDRIRTYCYLDDAAEMLTAALVLGSGQIYNVGGETATTIRDLGALIAQTLGVEFAAPVDDGHTSDNSPKTVSLDITKIKNLSGKSSFISIEDGVQETVIWFKKIYEGQS